MRHTHQAGQIFISLRPHDGCKNDSSSQCDKARTKLEEGSETCYLCTTQDKRRFVGGRSPDLRRWIGIPPSKKKKKALISTTTAGFLPTLENQ